MIPYEELVTALANWRQRQGLPPLRSDFLGAPRQHRIDAGLALGDDAGLALGDDAGMEPTNIINLDDAGADEVAGLYMDDEGDAASWDQEPQAVESYDDDDAGADDFDIASYQEQPYGGQQYGDGAYGAADAREDQYAQPGGHGQDAYGQPYGQQDAYGQNAYGQDAYGQPYGQQDGYGQAADALQGQYGYDSGPAQAPAQAYDSGPYGQSGGYGDPDAYGGADVAEEPTRMTYALQPSSAQDSGSYSSPGQPYPVPGQAYPAPAQPMAGVVDEREESTVIGAMLSPGAGPAPGESGGYDSGGGVPSEPVYDSLAAAAEYQAEQNYDDPGYGEATNAYQPLPAPDYGQSADYGQPYDPGAFSGGVSEETYIAPGMQQSAGGEPPPLEPPPEGDDDDFMINFDEDK